MTLDLTALTIVAPRAGFSKSTNSYETIEDAKSRLFSHDIQVESETVADW